MIWKAVLSLLLVSASLTADLQQAYQKYQQAEHTRDEEERKKLFNEALTFYLQAEPKHPSGLYYYNMANTYFQLGQYGYAILYYYKAQKLLGHDDRVAANLAISLQKAEVVQPNTSFIHRIFVEPFSYVTFSHNQKVVIVLLFLFLAFAFYSLYIWSPSAVWCRPSALFCFVVGLAFTCSLVWSEFLSPPEAVLVRATPVRVDAGMQYAPVADALSLPGMKVEIISVEKNGAWVKIRLPSGREGFVAQEYVRLI